MHFVFQILLRLKKYKGGPKFFLDAPPPANFGPKCCFFGKIVPNPSCIPFLKLLVSTVAEISRGPNFLLDAPVTKTPANFGPKRCFFGKLVPNPSCVPNLKLLASTVAKIRRGSQIFSLSREALLTLIRALIVSKLDYSCSMLSGVSGTLQRRLQSVFNAAARLVFSTRKSEHVTPLLQELHWLKVSEIIQFRLCVFVNRCLHGNAPPGDTLLRLYI